MAFYFVSNNERYFYTLKHLGMNENGSYAVKYCAQHENETCLTENDPSNNKSVVVDIQVNLYVCTDFTCCPFISLKGIFSRHSIQKNGKHIYTGNVSSLHENLNQRNRFRSNENN